MTHPDPELLRLLIQELERHVVALEAEPRDTADAKRSLHALRGSAGLAGERELAAALDRLHRRVREGDANAFPDAAAVVRAAIGQLSDGRTAIASTWPVPPDDLVARPLDSLVRIQYAAEVTDRLARIDEAVAKVGDPVELVRVLYRHVHTMKGASSAVGDEPMTWFCHGLEESIGRSDSTASARAAIHEVARWRVILGALLDEPEKALALLRGDGARRPELAAVARVSTVPQAYVDLRSAGHDEGSPLIRVQAADVDQLIESLEVIDRERERIAARAQRGREVAASMRDIRALLIDAQRLIGPSRPWGAPAAALRNLDVISRELGACGDELGTSSTALLATAQAMRDGVAHTRKQLSAMRQTTVGGIFARLTTAIETEARRTGRAVIVRTRGADEMVDRQIAEQLVEPCLQLVRNAVAHGIETPEARALLGKTPTGTVALHARKIGNRLRITIADDGAGVDVIDVRRRAVRAGLITPTIAEAADDDTLLSLLFLPGFSTRESSDLLAGRGIGLDITRASVQRLGGAIQLSSRTGEGFTARVDVPIERGLVTVLWVGAGDGEFALPAANAKRVETNDSGEARGAPHLLECLDAGVGGEGRYCIDLGRQAGDGDDAEPSAWVRVDRLGRTEELLVRPLGPLVSGLGPFAGAIVRGDGSLRLAIDAFAIVPRARALWTVGPGAAPARANGRS